MHRKKYSVQLSIAEDHSGTTISGLMTLSKIFIEVELVRALL